MLGSTINSIFASDLKLLFNELKQKLYETKRSYRGSETLCG